MNTPRKRSLRPLLSLSKGSRFRGGPDKLSLPT